MRMEPPPSLPVQAGNIADATAAAEPPAEPPGVRSEFQALRVTPCSGVLVKLTVPCSGDVVWAVITAPASRSRATSVQSKSATASLYGTEACVAGQPATSASSLTPIGIPANGPGSPPP